MGEGKGGTGRTGHKRKRVQGDDDNHAEEDMEESKPAPRDKSKSRRREQLGKKVDKEIYRKKRQKSADGVQWSA